VHGLCTLQLPLTVLLVVAEKLLFPATEAGPFRPQILFHRSPSRCHRRHEFTGETQGEAASLRSEP
jgi:hypothetical protein